MGHCRPKSKANKESKGVNGKPINPKDENALIGPRKPNKVSKKKLVKAHRNAELVKGTQEPISRKTNGHVKPLGERINDRPKRAQQD